MRHRSSVALWFVVTKRGPPARHALSALRFVLLGAIVSPQALKAQLSPDSFAAQPANPATSVDALFEVPGSSRAAVPNRLKWTLIGAGIGAVTGYLIAVPVDPYGDNRTGWTLGTAVFGALAGFVLSGPVPSEESGCTPFLSAFVPARGGIAIAVGI